MSGFDSSSEDAMGRTISDKATGTGTEPRRAAIVHIDPLDAGGWGWSVEWENGGKLVSASEDFPSAVTGVMGELREGQRHVSATGPVSAPSESDVEAAVRALKALQPTEYPNIARTVLSAVPSRPGGDADKLLERATALAEWYGEAIVSIGAALAEGTPGGVNRARAVIAGLEQSGHGPTAGASMARPGGDALLARDEIKRKESFGPTWDAGFDAGWIARERCSRPGGDAEPDARLVAAAYRDRENLLAALEETRIPRERDRLTDELVSVEAALREAGKALRSGGDAIASAAEDLHDLSRLLERDSQAEALCERALAKLDRAGIAFCPACDMGVDACVCELTEAPGGDAERDRLKAEKDEAQRQEHMAKNAEARLTRTVQRAAEKLETNDPEPRAVAAVLRAEIEGISAGASPEPGEEGAR